MRMSGVVAAAKPGYRRKAWLRKQSLAAVARRGCRLLTENRTPPILGTFPVNIGGVFLVLLICFAFVRFVGGCDRFGKVDCQIKNLLCGFYNRKAKNCNFHEL